MPIEEAKAVNNSIITASECINRITNNHKAFNLSLTFERVLMELLIKAFKLSELNTEKESPQ